MGRILVLFDSASGNTAKMASFVAEGARSVPEMDVRLLSVAEATKEDVLWCDGIAVGSPTNMGTLSWKMKRFWDEECFTIWGKVDGKIGCAFSSSGGWGGGNELVCMTIVHVLMNFGMMVFGVPDYVGPHHTLHYGAIQPGEPRTEAEVAACFRLGQRLAQFVSSMVDGNPEQHPLKQRKSTRA